MFLRYIITNCHSWELGSVIVFREIHVFFSRLNFLRILKYIWFIEFKNTFQCYATKIRNTMQRHTIRKMVEIIQKYPLELNQIQIKKKSFEPNSTEKNQSKQKKILWKVVVFILATWRLQPKKRVERATKDPVERMHTHSMKMWCDENQSGRLIWHRYHQAHSWPFTMCHLLFYCSFFVVLLILWCCFLVCVM